MSGAEVRISRARANPCAWTFTIKPIKEIVERYVGDGKGWVDPFAGRNSPAEFTNDHDPESPARWHLDAEEWCREMAVGGLSVNDYQEPIPVWATPPFAGVIFDPPYSYRQITEHYKRLGMKATQLDTSANFYNRVMNAICDAIKPGGYAISCGWNSSGFGKNRGFELVEVLLVNHGMSHHNDTIVVVERKL